MGLQLVLHGTKIHRLFDHLVVVVDVQFGLIDRFLEDPGIRTLAQDLDHPRTSFLPVIVNFGRRVYVRDIKFGKFLVGIEEIFSKIRVTFSEIFKFLKGNWPVLTLIKDLEREVLGL